MGSIHIYWLSTCKISLDTAHPIFLHNEIDVAEYFPTSGRRVKERTVSEKTEVTSHKISVPNPGQDWIPSP